MKKLLVGVMLIGTVVAVNSCRSMSDETYDAITATHQDLWSTWCDSTLVYDYDLSILDEMLAKACEEHGYSVAAFKQKAKQILYKIEKEILNATTVEELQELHGKLVLTEVYGAIESDKDKKQYEDVCLSYDQAFFIVWNTELSESLTDIEKEVANISSFKEAKRLDSKLHGLVLVTHWDEIDDTEEANEKNKAKLREIKAQIIDQARNYQKEAPIVITSIYSGRPNSAGGVDVYITFINKSDKTFKYVSFEVTPYNAVSDEVFCSIGRTNPRRLKDTGPYKPGRGSNGAYYWSCIWYNYTIRSIKLNSVCIEYMDGTRKVFSGDWVSLLKK